MHRTLQIHHPLYFITLPASPSLLWVPFLRCRGDRNRATTQPESIITFKMPSPQKVHLSGISTDQYQRYFFKGKSLQVLKKFTFQGFLQASTTFAVVSFIQQQ
jgi:hypothetical protein